MRSIATWVFFLFSYSWRLMAVSSDGRRLKASIIHRHFALSSGNEGNHNGRHCGHESNETGSALMWRDRCVRVCRSVGRIRVGSLYADVGDAESETAMSRRTDVIHGNDICGNLLILLFHVSRAYIKRYLYYENVESNSITIDRINRIELGLCLHWSIFWGWSKSHSGSSIIKRPQDQQYNYRLWIEPWHLRLGTAESFRFGYNRPMNVINGRSA